MDTRAQNVTHSPQGEGKTVWIVGTDLVTFKATGEETGGAFALFDSLVLPGGGPPPHIHTREAESFYVLEGEFEFLAGDRWIQAAPGSFVHVPKGVLHTLKNAGEDVGRLLTLVVPAGLDEFFAELGVPGDDVSSPPHFGPQEIEALLKTAERYGIEIPPPREEQVAP
jgi:quercetin dioxygenase-like cupin family protein